MRVHPGVDGRREGEAATMRIWITMELDDEFADPEHESGVKEGAHLSITTWLGSYGDDIDIVKEDLAKGDDG